MNRGKVGEERRGKETDGCPLTGDVIENHTWSERYETKDIDRVLYAIYDSDALMASRSNIYQVLGVRNE
jgi:hypothetical protein